MKLAKGLSIANGGRDGEVAWILTGLAAYSYPNAASEPRIFGLVPPGRMMGNIDAYTSRIVNVVDFALRPIEAFLMPAAAFRDALAQAPALTARLMKNIVDEHEADLEGAASIASDPVERRIARLYAALIFRDSPRETFDFASACKTLTAPQPIPYALSVTETARIVGATRVRVSGILAQFERDGRIVRKRDGERLIAPSLFEDIADWLSAS